MLNKKKSIIINEIFFDQPNEVVFRSISQLIRDTGNKKSFARGKKIGIVNFSTIKKPLHDGNSLFTKFYFKKNGKFWIKNKDITELNKVLNFLLQSSNKKWIKAIAPYKNLFLFDKDNQKFRKIIRSI